MSSRDYLASQLAKFLRLNGEKVINGTCKLSLTTSALCLLNSTFTDVLSNNQYESSYSSTSTYPVELCEDARFLYDFIRKTPSLKLFHGMQTLRGGVDLSNFSNLTVLELHKVPAHLLIGLNSFCTQLKVLICSRSICYIKELFANCIEESNSVRTWTKLQELNVSHNYLEGFDESLNYLPYIENFNASHNNLKHIDEIQILEKLVALNLSFNLLDTLPYLSNLSCYSLKILYVRNNILEDLAGLECMLNLEEFDASYNCLSEHSVLKPLAKLKLLRVLNLEGNPLYYHKKHEMLTIRCLHRNVVTNGLVLNRQRLTAKETLMYENKPKYVHPPSLINFHQTSINVIVENSDSKLMPSNRHNHVKTAAVVTNVLSESSENIDYSEEEPLLDNKTAEEPLIEKNMEKQKTPKIKEREAEIHDPEESVTDLSEPINLINLASDTDAASSIPNHVQTRLLLENRRREYGKEWLLPSHTFPAIIPDAYDNIPKVPINTPILNDPNASFPEKHVSAELLDEKLTTLSEEPGAYKMVTTVYLSNNEIQTSESETLPAKNSERRQSQACSDIVVLAVDQYEPKEHYISDDNQSEEESSKFNLDDSDEEAEGRIFAVDKKNGDKTKSLFIVITDRFMKEKDFLTGKVIDTLDLRSLLSVKMNKYEMNDAECAELNLLFDTIKLSRQKHTYIFDNTDSAQRMLDILKPFSDAKTFQDIVLGALQCLKCSSQFSKELANRKVLKTQKPHSVNDSLPSSYDSSKGYLQEVDLCPNCGSNMVVETETVPLPGLDPLMKPTKQSLFSSGSPKLKRNASCDSSSVGSPSSGNYFSNLFSSKKHSPSLLRKKTQEALSTISSTSEKEMFSDSNNKDLNKTHSFITSYVEAQTPCEKESVPSENPSIRRNSSEATFISNQSQSSITVISDTESNIADTETFLSWPSSPKPPPDLNQKIDPTSNLVSDALSAGSESTCTASCLSPSHKHSERSYVSSPDEGAQTDFYSITESFEAGNKGDNECKTDTSRCSKNEMCNTNIDSDNNATCVTSFENFDTSDSLKLIDLCTSKEKVSFETFKSVDHRLKLHLEINVFKHDEEFEACLKTDIVPHTSADEFKGFFIVSSKKLYIMKMLKDNVDTWDKNLKQIYTCPLNQLKSISVLLGSQGFSIICGSDSKLFFLLLRDADLCNCFISYLTDILKKLLTSQLPNFIEYTKEYLDQLNKEVISTYHPFPSKQETEVLLHLFVFWKSSARGGAFENHTVCIVVSPVDIFVSKIVFQKHSNSNKPNSELYFSYIPLEKQKICNLISVEVKENLKECELLFVDEDENSKCKWIVRTQTRSSLLSFINSLRSPWESIFGIELPLS